MLFILSIKESKIKADKGLKLVSDNQLYDPYYITPNEIMEIWRAKGYISTEMPQPTPEPTMESLTTMMLQMQRSISQLQQEKNN